MLAQANSTQLASTLNLMCQEQRLKHFSFLKRLLVAESDKEVETSFVHFMQMYRCTYTLYVCRRGIAVVKISLPSPSLAHPDAPRAQAFASFFSFKCRTALSSGKGNVLLTRGPWPVKDSCSQLEC